LSGVGDCTFAYSRKRPFASEEWALYLEGNINNIGLIFLNPLNILLKIMTRLQEWFMV
jgi:hypothetical protein